MTRARLIAGGVAATALTVLAEPWFVPRGFELLFLLSAFLLRLMDRRWTLRSGWRGWTSHVRLKPARLLVWIAAVLAGGISALAAALLAELLLYPMMTTPFGKFQRGGLLALMIVAGTMLEGLTRVGWGFDLLRCLSLYSSGVILGIFWLRGPDGEPEAALIAGGGVALFGAVGWALPASISWSVPATGACLLLLFAHLTTLRRVPLHWRGHGAPALRLSFKLPRVRPATPPA
ncbi:hypothetical protein [Sphingobium aromaticiconvertens]|uniref:hypothetical protein n=1 Tax=Sphingobium aromaticiconvertens TaxID=365341 RepID=UPI00301AA051